MKKGYFALIGMLMLLAGCSDLQGDSVTLEPQRVEHCDFAGRTYRNSAGNLIASGAANCRFIRDGRDSALANSHLQRRRADGTWATLSSSPGKTYTLPSNVNDAWHLFDDLFASGECNAGVYRSIVTVRWPLGVTNQNTKSWTSSATQYGCS
jgi:hypothetical protein